jgi:hypothetical protein
MGKTLRDAVKTDNIKSYVKGVIGSFRRIDYLLWNNESAEGLEYNSTTREIIDRLTK